MNNFFSLDYVDRGLRSLEVACLLICLKMKYPNKARLYANSTPFS